jgi:5-methylcytosine-specific restriction endonuclease McrA
MKTCSKCDKKKELEDFHKDKARSDGHEPSCKLCKSLAKKDYYKNNIELLNDKVLIRYFTKSEEINEKKKPYQKEWRKINNAKCRFYAAKYRAIKLKASPSWLTADHLNEIRSVYNESKKLEEFDGIQRHVDHIVPLQGETVSGLHVPWNLQILTKTENLKKKNNLEVIDVKEMGEDPQ